MECGGFVGRNGAWMVTPTCTGCDQNDSGSITYRAVHVHTWPILSRWSTWHGTLDITLLNTGFLKLGHWISWHKCFLWTTHKLGECACSTQLYQQEGCPGTCGCFVVVVDELLHKTFVCGRCMIRVSTVLNSPSFFNSRV